MLNGETLSRKCGWAVDGVRTRQLETPLQCSAEPQAMYGEMIPVGLGGRRVTSSRGRTGCWVEWGIGGGGGEKRRCEQECGGALAGRARFSLVVWPG